MEKDKDTRWAKRQNGDPIHILDASSGRAGYFCLDCNSEMQAVKSKIKKRASYFRHDPKDRLLRQKCKYSDIRERHRIAKEILGQLKQIKVPGLTKYPSRGESGMPLRVFDSMYLNAFKVVNERFFYEDENHDIHWGNESDSPRLQLLSKADVVFLDQKEDPVLIIQFVDRHKKISDETKVKLRSLRIDTVQIRIPNDAQDEIRKAFLKPENIKWLYNNEYERAQLTARVSDSDTGAVSATDELQRDFFEENFYCRRAQIKRLIRRIAIYLESQQHKQAEARIRAEIDGVDNELRTSRVKELELQERAKAEIQREFEEQSRSIREQENELSKSEIRIDQLHKEIERRYKRKAEDLQSNHRDLKSRIDSQFTEIGVRGSTVETRRRKIENEILGIERNITAGRRRIEATQRQAKALHEKFLEDERKLRAEYEQLEKDESRDRDKINERIRQVIATGVSGLPGGFEGIDDIRGILKHSIEIRSSAKRIREAWQSLRAGAYKDWRQ